MMNRRSSRTQLLNHHVVIHLLEASVTQPHPSGLERLPESVRSGRCADIARMLMARQSFQLPVEPLPPINPRQAQRVSALRACERQVALTIAKFSLPALHSLAQAVYPGSPGAASA